MSRELRKKNGISRVLEKWTYFNPMPVRAGFDF